jgi:hypothetical protein
MAIAAGEYDIALALGAEKMKDRGERGLVREGHHPLLARGVTAPGQFALAATRYFHTYGLTPEEGKEKVILLNWSGHGIMDLGGYESYFSGKLIDYPLPEEEMRKVRREIQYVYQDSGASLDPGGP